jgi:hypothetical protein
MREGQGQERRRWGGTVCLLLALAFVPIWVGCGAANEHSVSVPEATSPTPTLQSLAIEPKLATETAYILHEEQYATRVALTPGTKRTVPPGGPTPTEQLGMLSGCGARTNANAPWTISCWRGYIGGQLTDVGAGRYGATSHGEGLIVVTTWSPYQEDVYETPEQVGPVKIASVDGTRFTLVPYDPWRLQTPEATLTPAPNVAFVFDIVTREWLTPTPGPSPSVSVSPIPSVSPLPTQMP